MLNCLDILYSLGRSREFFSRFILRLSIIIVCRNTLPCIIESIGYLREALRLLSRNDLGLSCSLLCQNRPGLTSLTHQNFTTYLILQKDNHMQLQILDLLRTIFPVSPNTSFAWRNLNLNHPWVAMPRPMHRPQQLFYPGVEAHELMLIFNIFMR